MIRFRTRRDQEKQIRPILARQVWLSESAASPPCGQDLAVAAAFVEQRLTAIERRRFQSHLLDCRHCRQFVAAEVRLRRQSWEQPAAPINSRKVNLREVKSKGLLPWRVPQYVAGAAALLVAAAVAGFLTGPRHPTPLNSPEVARTAALGSRPPALAPTRSPSPATAPVAAHDRRDRVRPVVLTETQPEAAAPTEPQPGPAPAAGNQEFRFGVDGTEAVSASDPGSGPDNRAGTPAAGDSPVTEYLVQVEPVSLTVPTSDRSSRSMELPPDSLPVAYDTLTLPGVAIPSVELSDEDNHSEVMIVARAQFAPGLSSARDIWGERHTAVPPLEEAQLVHRGKRFKVIDRVLVDREFISLAGLPAVKVKAKSPEMKNLIAQQPGLRSFFQLAKRVIVVYEGTAYMSY